MRSYRTRIHGHAIEVREGDFGGQTLLVDGAVVWTRAMAGWWPSRTGMMFTLTDEAGRSRRVEVLIVTAGKLGIDRELLVNVDGEERCRVKASKASDAALKCLHCGYDLKGLAVENGEIRCPECGRHRGME